VIVEMISEGRPIRLVVSQLVVSNDEGTPVAVAAEFGRGAIKTAHVLDADFQSTLRALGVGRHNIEVIELPSQPVPGGAKRLFVPEGA
jgi:hypothetical protein